VAQQPPEPLGPAHVPVGDDEHALADPGARGSEREFLDSRQRVAALPLNFEVGQLVDPEERSARNVLREVRLAARVDAVE